MPPIVVGVNGYEALDPESSAEQIIPPLEFVVSAPPFPAPEQSRVARVNPPVEILSPSTECICGAVGLED